MKKRSQEASSWPGLIGYLNFSRGKSDARFAKQINDAFDWLERRGVKEPWRAMADLLAYLGSIR